jgi:putative spermidine/putrescine transport system permease protein
VTAAIATQAPLRRGTLRRLGIGPHVLLLLPAGIVLVGLFGFPMAWLLQFSLTPSGRQPILLGPATLEQYGRFLGDWFYLERILGTTLRVSLLSCAIAVLIGYPMAFWIARVGNPRLKAALIAAVLCPLWLNTVIRVFGVMLLLFDNGPVTGALAWVGLPGMQLLYNETGVVIGLSYLAIPFFVIAMIGVVEQLDSRQIEAAHSLGAGPLYVFRRVILPATLPGVLAGFVLIFCISIASFAIPMLLGGGKVPMIGMLIYREAVVSGNVAFAAAMSFILLATTILALTCVSLALHRVAGGRRP